MEVDADVRRRTREKTRTVSADQPTIPPSDATDTGRHETVGDHDDERRRVEEPEAPRTPVSSDMETKDDEISADVPLPEEPAEMSGDQPQGWITEEAFFTVSPGAR